MNTTIVDNESNSEETTPTVGQEMDLPNNIGEIMSIALEQYNEFVNLTDTRDLKSAAKQAFREKATALLKIITHQSNLIAQMEGAVQELRNTPRVCKHAELNTASKDTAKTDKPTFASIAKRNTPPPKMNNTALNTSKKQHLAVT
ncbi:hypothetical protein CDAR_122041 [Caerostris darwini]|uniref:Uncharacterized protein n=1 Tax=Caerostris darwini TaxID=1538125 RepID=A0AAV4PN63_9ARAC|nr:hypothetical protein CDAR_122041 [Caerostris darwini]